MLPDSTQLTSATLLVKDLPALTGFYRDVIGLGILTQDATYVTLGDQGTTVLRLEENTQLPYPGPQAAGLYHLAFLFSHPSRLAQAIEMIGQKAPSLYQGSADHLVSQAFYLSDPEGNGIELYVDRPRSEWEWKDGQIVMGSLPLDPNQFHAQHIQEQPEGSIGLGHVHLKVGDIDQAQKFYHGLLGFDTVFAMPTALFVAAGGYHHHIGLNTWESLGAPYRIPALGLKQFGFKLGDATAFSELRQRLQSSKLLMSEGKSTLVTEDPWGNSIVIEA